MKMGRIGLDHCGWYRLRLVYHEDAPLIVRPFGHSCLIRRGILLAQPWPPLPLEPSFPSQGIGGADDETRHAHLVLRDETKLRLQNSIGSGIDVAHQLLIAVKRGCIASRQPCRKRNRMERIHVAWLKRADVHHGKLDPVTLLPYTRLLPR